jgi:hypothetical protein
MTTELEQEFFKVFGIEPMIYSLWDSKETQIKNFKSYVVYPEITDRKLLEMICIYNSTYTNGYTNYSLLNERTVEKLKEQILKNCLIVRNDIKHQIQQLFKEGE